MVDNLTRHCEDAAQIVASWPAWKRNVLGWWHSENKAHSMTPEQWRNHGRDGTIPFDVVEMADYPPVAGEIVWCEWLRHIDGREVLLLRGSMGPFNGVLGDVLARSAFGRDACHACVSRWANGTLVDGEYRPLYITTHAKPKLLDRGEPCVKCRARLAKQCLDEAQRYVAMRFGIGCQYTVPEQWGHRFASVAGLTYPT